MVQTIDSSSKKEKTRKIVELNPTFSQALSAAFRETASWKWKAARSLASRGLLAAMTKDRESTEERVLLKL